MPALLDELGILSEVQAFFQDSFTVDKQGMLIFNYGQHTECFSDHFHRVPVTDQVWLAGDRTFQNIRNLIICNSAMDAMAFLSANFASYQRTDHLLFLSVGLVLNPAHVEWIKSVSRNLKVGLVLGNDLLGKIADIRLATGIRGHSMLVNIAGRGLINITFRDHDYSFHADTLSLASFERTTKFRSHIRTYKPKLATSFLSGLQLR